jgi:branched-chain amino acid transport system permease protein
MAIRDNEIAASAMGVDVALYKTLAFGVSAGITGVAGGLGAIAVQFVAPDGYTITLAISLFLGMVVGGVGWLPGSIVGSAFIIFVPNIAEGISKGLSGAVFGVLLSWSSSWYRTAQGRSRWSPSTCSVRLKKN